MDILLLPLSLVFLPVLKLVRRLGVEHFPLHRKAFAAIGVFPIRNHYYEPQLTYADGFDATKKRNLPLDFDIKRQLHALAELSYGEELKDLRRHAGHDQAEFFINNDNFGAGDAELYYLMIRNTKPKKIIEIGSGFSTLLAAEAIRKKKQKV